MGRSSRRWKGGPGCSSCCFLSKSLKGPESRAAALGRRARGEGLDTWVLRGYGEGAGRGPWGQKFRARDCGGKRVREPSPTRGLQSEAPPLGPRPRPLPTPHCPQTKRSPPPARPPGLCLGPSSSTPLFPSSSPSLLPSLLSPDLSRSHSPPLPLSSLRTPGSSAPPPLGAPTACELTEGLQTWGGGVSCLPSPVRT